MTRHRALQVVLLLGILGLLSGVTGVLVTHRAAAPAAGGPAGERSLRPAPGPQRPPVLPALTRGLLPTASGLQAALALALQDPRLGSAPAFSVVDVVSGQLLLSGRTGVGVVPASTAKIATAIAVLLATAPDQRLHTTVLAGPLPGDVVLVGGGDPTLAGPGAAAAAFAPARLADLAVQVRRNLGATRVQRVLVDDRLFPGAATGPGWKSSYVSSGNVAPVMALMVDGGRLRPGEPARAADPALAAGRAFAQLLSSPQHLDSQTPLSGAAAGTRTTAAIAVGRGHGEVAAIKLGDVNSPPIAVLVEQMLEHSDNDLAEALTRQVALARGLPASFAGGATAVAAVLVEFAGPAVAAAIVLRDGSGLSREDRVQPVALAELLAEAAGQQRLRPLLSGLPVAGFDGTLALRFRATGALPAAGRVRAKTGTLDGISALAGVVRTREGRLLAFDLTTDGVPSGGSAGAEAALDALAAVLASCGCR